MIRAVASIVCLSLPLVACKEEASTPTQVVPLDATAELPPASGALRFDVVFPESHAGLAAAAADLLAVVERATGRAPGAVLPVGATATGKAITVTLGAADAPDDQSYALTSDARGVTVKAKGPVAAMYGLYRIAADLGALWPHPEEDFVPLAPNLTLPTYSGTWDTPRFALRGFHEHTQHPIPMSDYLLRPGNADFRARAGRYLRWMARNRQNVLFFHALKTLDLPTWTPYMQELAAEARGYGIHLGAVVGFADEQQHAFKLIATASPDPDADIRKGLDALLASGLDFVGFQIGTSEFTKPKDADVLHWLDVATTHVTEKHPSVTPFAWIHITCSVKADAGGYFFHLPLQASTALGAFVHTTMFYTLDAPAPVYDCTNFTHQKAFIDQAEGKRTLVFFPETAWWLGFDNNVPLVLPVTGLSRERDIATLKGRKVAGHVTFTTGREWTYWQYDHHLTRATWDGTSWSAYLKAIAPLYGSAGAVVSDVIAKVTAIQERVLYHDNPEVFFYLSGELPQDEAGAAAGILARRPKIAFKTVVGYDAATFATWKTRDYDVLVALASELEAATAPLDAIASPAAPTDAEGRRRLEVQAAYRLLHRRVRHAVALYGGAIAIRDKKRSDADARLVEAQALSAEVKALVARVEGTYREPLPILAEPKPETLTAYPIGYLSETRSAFFWTRRDAQLAELITDVFDAKPDAWTTVPAKVFATTPKDLTLLEPASPVAAGVLTGFLPGLLFGVTMNGTSADVRFAEDANANGLPDAGTEVPLNDDVADGRLTAHVARVDLVVHDSAGATVGTIGLLSADFDFALATDGLLGVGTLAGGLESKPLIDAVLAIAGIDRAGIESLVKSVFGVPADQPLPATLPVKLEVHPKPL